METSPSRHHLFSPKKDYRTRLEHRFRNQTGLVIPDVPRDLHDTLHIEVPHPPKPTHGEMVDIFGRLAHVPDEQRVNPYWGLLSVVEYYHDIQGERAFQGRLIAKNLIQQLCVLQLIELDAA